MSSSTSSFEAARAWRRFAFLLVLCTAGLIAGIVGAAYAIDPYDTGRSRLFEKRGVRAQGPRTAAASRGRDPAFDSAIVGNSHVQLLSPERLRGKSGLSFVQLSVPATRPHEQLVLIDWFLRHREAPAKALVIGIDETWCTADPALENDRPFPFWLFSANPLAYLRGLMRYDILEELPRRLSYLASDAPERARPDGYWDYEPNYAAFGYAERPDIRAALERSPDGGAGPPPARLPAAEALQAAFAAFPVDLDVVLVFPPQYIVYQPRAGTPRGAADEACKAAFRRLAAERPRTRIVDWRTDRPENRIAANYIDQTHYRRNVAEAVEDEVAAAIVTGP
jgi:hypothetical protein